MPLGRARGGGFNLFPDDRFTFGNLKFWNIKSKQEVHL